ncbi:hypothetical protein Cgig2_016796 [Carnegiea gigantea]|uniref:Uncharacterized protein n=1 Tax=Carnegiea gigantea TaxID=171969 RepID=A0A9Q1GUS1_9CARY|nr:hypothetical protein Cgig2_016796 [Carnegiea gigantea]
MAEETSMTELKVVLDLGQPPLAAASKDAHCTVNDEIEPHDDHKQFMNEGPVVGLKPRPATSISDIDGAKFLRIVILQPQDTVKEMVRLGVYTTDEPCSTPRKLQGRSGHHSVASNTSGYLGHIPETKTPYGFKVATKMWQPTLLGRPASHAGSSAEVPPSLHSGSNACARCYPCCGFQVVLIMNIPPGNRITSYAENEALNIPYTVMSGLSQTDQSLPWKLVEVVSIGLMSQGSIPINEALLSSPKEKQPHQLQKENQGTKDVSIVAKLMYPSAFGAILLVDDKEDSGCQ